MYTDHVAGDVASDEFSKMTATESQMPLFLKHITYARPDVSLASRVRNILAGLANDNTGLLRSDTGADGKLCQGVLVWMRLCRPKHNDQPCRGPHAVRPSSHVHRPAPQQHKAPVPAAVNTRSQPEASDSPSRHPIRRSRRLAWFQTSLGFLKYPSQLGP